jgi:asparagine synthase (glutamine-hydrolysing)
MPDDVLAKADRATMLQSLEMRTQFLERNLAEFAAMVPPDVHVGRPGKRLLRGVLGRVLPGYDRGTRKTAFQVPARDWFRGPLASPLRELVAGSRVFDEGWLDRGAITGLVDEHLAADHDHSSALWPVLALGLWLERLRAGTA